MAGSTGETSNARFSPDGKNIGFCETDEISVVKCDGTHARRLIAGWSPAYSPDGSRIVFLGGRLGRQLRMMDSDGTNVSVVYEARSPISGPMFWPDAKCILFVNEGLPNGTGEILRIDLKTRRLEPLISTDLPNVGENKRG